MVPSVEGRQNQWVKARMLRPYNEQCESLTDYHLTPPLLGVQAPPLQRLHHQQRHPACQAGHPRHPEHACVPRVPG